MPHALFTNTSATHETMRKNVKLQGRPLPISLDGCRPALEIREPMLNAVIESCIKTHLIFAIFPLQWNSSRPILVVLLPNKLACMVSRSFFHSSPLFCARTPFLSPRYFAKAPGNAEKESYFRRCKCGRQVIPRFTFLFTTTNERFIIKEEIHTRTQCLTLGKDIPTSL